MKDVHEDLTGPGNRPSAPLGIGSRKMALGTPAPAVRGLMPENTLTPAIVGIPQADPNGILVSLPGVDVRKDSIQQHVVTNRPG